jgi:hypothetical protein
MSALVGYMFPFAEGFKALCPDCAYARTSEHETELTPLFGANLGAYQQHCAHCGDSINTHANPLFPELFDGK